MRAAGNHHIEAFTDGGCHGNPGPGAWAYYITDVSEDAATEPREGSGGEPMTTNNRMELTAVIEALRAIHTQRQGSAGGGPPAAVVLYTDSRYVQQGITDWIRRWRANGWQTASKQPVKNAELWRSLDTLATAVQADFRWVRGHAGDPRNERCHELVQEAIAALDG